MNDCHAVLLDTVSIQSYIFQSNKLRENLGASFLVEEIFRTYLACALCTITGRTLAEELKLLNWWKTAKSESPDCSNAVEIGYIGGGNALLFFSSKTLACKFIEEWTKLLLLHAPGLTTAMADDFFPFAPQKFSESLKALFRKLEQNKAEYLPITSFPRHGITAECRHSGFSAEIFTELSEEYISASTYARIEAANASRAALENKYKDLLGEQFCFTNELEELGGKPNEDSHIAVVHIDGNEIGERFFKNAKELREIRALSKSVHDATANAFYDLMKLIVEKYATIMHSLGLEPEADATKRKILPIRPIILGGDDVTFVCNGKLGIYFAKYFIEAFEKGEASDGNKLTACAGVAIIKTKYPFYRGVELANKLCSNAKKIRKEKNSSASFLDFHIALGGIAGTLQEIRKAYFHVPQGSLHFRPFKIVPKEPFDESSLDLFLEKTWFFQRTDEGKLNLPNTKIEELRHVLTLPEEATQKFVQELKYRRRKLPKIEGRHYEETLFQNGVTPYFDMIEILRFYPDFALREAGEKK